ncbi:MAG: sulfatase-like hydrolase/transferase [Chloroflexi bacterium]|nr:sulfatase-like hydrolase/transferase [Chloroflexota bacterium]
MSQISRRDFLKVAGVIAAGTLASRQLISLGSTGRQNANVIIVLCDSLSAAHLSLHGYPRPATPNIDAFAGISTVYHRHYSAGNFTTPGTASMLTGMLPWKHRAINQGGLVRSDAVCCNPYSLLGSEYNRFAFSQNIWADYLLGQFSRDIDRFLPLYSHSLLKDEDSNLENIFWNDHALSSMAINDFLIPMGDEPVGTAIFGYFGKFKFLDNDEYKSVRYSGGIPRAMNSIPYLNEEVFQGVYKELLKLNAEEKPYFSYFHLWSPHDPYKPRNDFKNLFKDDGYAPVPKPIHTDSPGFDEEYLASRRIVYDRQVAQVDFEFGNLIENLSASGVLENSYLIFTSDHGELFERGFVGHGNQLMYEPVLHIPLLVHAPGQTGRKDVFSLTSNIDLLPTLLSITGRELNSDIDGEMLPGLGGQADEQRPIFSVFAIENSAFAPIKKAVITMHKHTSKLIAYLGYDDKVAQSFELYDLESDPEELNNLAARDVKTLSAMKEEFFTYLNEANRLFVRK